MRGLLPNRDHLDTALELPRATGSRSLRQSRFWMATGMSGAAAELVPVVRGITGRDRAMRAAGNRHLHLSRVCSVLDNIAHRPAGGAALGHSQKAGKWVWGNGSSRCWTRAAAKRLSTTEPRDLVVLDAAVETFICREFTTALPAVVTEPGAPAGEIACGVTFQDAVRICSYGCRCRCVGRAARGGRWTGRGSVSWRASR